MSTEEGKGVVYHQYRKAIINEFQKSGLIFEDLQKHRRKGHNLILPRNPVSILLDYLSLWFLRLSLRLSVRLPMYLDPDIREDLYAVRISWRSYHWVWDETEEEYSNRVGTGPVTFRVAKPDK